jgi:hypothetical protein
MSAEKGGDLDATQKPELLFPGSQVWRDERFGHIDMVAERLCNALNT